MVTCAADIPLSAIGDTLTLPYVFYVMLKEAVKSWPPAADGAARDSAD
jgi:uncharacterized protein YceK